jgi:aspartate-semialdehyde dehydrogenase
MKNAYLAIVGGQSLIGREVRDVLAKSYSASQVKLIGVEDEEVGGLTEQGGELVVVSALDQENLAGAALVLLAGSPASSHRAFEVLASCHPRPLVIDLTYAFDDGPDARLRAPFIEPPGHQVPAGAIHVIAHPAAIVLAQFLTWLDRRFPVQRSVAHIFEPASERGKRGIEELRQQTVGLLSFKTLDKAVYDAQVSFNLLARYGEEAPLALQDIEGRIERHLATLLSAAGRAPLPSLRLVQAPVFHGHSFSLWVEFQDDPGESAVSEALHASGLDVRGPDLDPPTNVGMAGQGGFAVGAIAADRHHAKACWFWLASDNLCVMAGNAVGVIRSLLPAMETRA